MEATILNKWIESINENNLDAILSLYSESAILVPTLSKIIRKNKLEIKDYFIHFLENKGLKAEVKEVHIQSLYNDTIKINSGNYLFSYYNEKNEFQELTARFSFVIKDNIILEHHSSIAPTNN